MDEPPFRTDIAYCITADLSPSVTKAGIWVLGARCLAAVPVRLSRHGGHHRVIAGIVRGYGQAGSVGLHPSGGPVLITNDAQREVGRWLRRLDAWCGQAGTP
jgi:hypothetical protein